MPSQLSARSKPKGILSKKIRNIYSRSVVPSDANELSQKSRRSVSRKPRASNSPGVLDRIKRFFTLKRRDAPVEPMMTMVRNPLLSKGGRKTMRKR